jgi:hypothetical protein
MSEFVRLLLDSIAYLWPFHRVELFERALYTVCGRWQWEVGPGVWPLIPWFVEVKAESVVEGIVSTPRIDLTLKDGRQLSCSLSATVRVANLPRAINKVDAYMETATELMAAVAAEKILEVEADRLNPDKRGRLTSDLKKWIQAEADQYGVEFVRLRFTSFVFAPRFYRVMSDQGTASPW